MGRALSWLAVAGLWLLAANAALSGADAVAWGVAGLFIAVALSGLVALRSAPPQRARLVAVAVASLIGLYAIEGYEWGFGLYAPPRLPETYDWRTKFEVVLDLRDQDVDAYPTIHPAAYIGGMQIGGRPTMPFGGVSNAVTVYCKENETGEYLVYDSDEHGFNNPRGTWRRERVDVALVGDSFTQGACVLEGSFAEHLRATFDGVLNVGSGNNGPLIELATIKEYLGEYRPPFVLWFYYEGNDLGNLTNERQNALLLRYLASDFRQEIRARQPEIDAHMRGMVNASVKQIRAAGGRGVVHEEAYGPREFARLSLLQKHLRRLGHDPRAAGSEEAARAELRFFARVLREARDTVASWGGQLYFVYLPAYEVLRRGAPELYREEVLAAARSNEIPIIDIDTLVRALPDPLSVFPFEQDGVHYTQEGNRMVADAVIEALRGRDSPSP